MDAFSGLCFLRHSQIFTCFRKRLSSTKKRSVACESASWEIRRRRTVGGDAEKGFLICYSSHHHLIFLRFISWSGMKWMSFMDDKQHRMAFVSFAFDFMTPFQRLRHSQHTLRLSNDMRRGKRWENSTENCWIWKTHYRLNYGQKH